MSLRKKNHKISNLTVWLLYENSKALAKFCIENLQNVILPFL